MGWRLQAPDPKASDRGFSGSAAVESESWRSGRLKPGTRERSPRRLGSMTGTLGPPGPRRSCPMRDRVRPDPASSEVRPRSTKGRPSRGALGSLELADRQHRSLVHLVEDLGGAQVDRGEAADDALVAR